MIGVDPKAFEFALSKIDDGYVFERFALDFLSKYLGYSFIPAGGMKDRGIDGLEHTFNRDKLDRTIYQASIEKDPRSKLRNTIEKLKANRIPHERVFFVTNQRVPAKDSLIDQLFDEYGVPVAIWDVEWLRSRVNESEATLRAYLIFVESYLHEFTQPGKSYAVANLEGDPRLFVFLRQLWDEYRDGLPLEEILADSLILFALEGTDPDKEIIRSRDEILAEIAKHVTFDPASLRPVIDRRLVALSRKPRRINHYRKQDAYCLPYLTRLEIQNRNLRDMALYEDFRTSTMEKLYTYLPDEYAGQVDCIHLIEEVLHQVFRQQGLEFTNFVLHNEAGSAVEKSLPDITAQVVDDNAPAAGGRTQIKSSLLMAIREIVYNGTPAQSEFLVRLCRTYMMLFLLQCDPKLAIFFASMASKLRIYVCTSILIPALSEQFLEEQNQRYSSLLRGARDAGARLLVNDTIVRELAAHFRMIKSTFESVYAAYEGIYSEEPEILYIPEIMIRAYFYSRMRGTVSNFSEFLSAFVSRTMKHTEEDLVAWLDAAYGVEYVSDASLNISVDPGEEEALTKALLPFKSAEQSARNDARIILTIHAIRERGNEIGSGGIFGYQTWWLSMDTITERAVRQLFGQKYQTSSYMRPDFLYHLVSLAPSRATVDHAFREIFPSLVGVSVSYHLPSEVTGLAHRFIREHAQTNPARVKAVLRELSDRLKSDPHKANHQFVKHFLDEQRERLADLGVGA